MAEDVDDLIDMIEGEIEHMDNDEKIEILFDLIREARKMISKLESD